MDLSIRGVTTALQGADHAAAGAIASAMTAAGHAEAGLANQLVSAARGVLNRLPGGMNIGTKVFGSPRTPMTPFVPGEMTAPHPGDFPILTRDGVSTCGNIQAWGGNEPFPLQGFVNLAAGSQTQGTDLIDFHASASNPTWITTNDLIPGNIEVFQASLALAPRLQTTLAFEGVGFFYQWWMIEYINGIEKARWSMRQLSAVIGATGLLTSGAAAGFQPLNMPAIPWHRKYDPNVKAKTTLQISVTTTTVCSIDSGFIEEGVRP